MITVTNCFSALIASGNGQRCNILRQQIHKGFLTTDEYTGQVKSILFKYGEKNYPELHKQLRIEMGHIITSLVKDIDPVFFGKDIKGETKDCYTKEQLLQLPNSLSSSKEEDILIFRKTIESFMHSGHCGSIVGIS